jgi:hypothetical protein
MTNQQIINIARSWLDDLVPDATGNYLWNDLELCLYLNQVAKDFARLTKSISDSDTATICTYSIYPNVATLSISALIIEINGGHLTNNSFPLGVRSQKWFDQNVSGWRSTKGQPLAIIPNYKANTIRFYPYYDLVYNGVTYAPTAVIDTLNLDITRLPLTEITMSTLSSTPPDIDSSYHLSLVHGILGYAYMKRDSQTFDPKKALDHKTEFEAACSKVVEDQIVMNRDDTNFSPHPGAI